MLKTIADAYAKEKPRSWKNGAARVLQVVDGDTLDIEITSETVSIADFGFGVKTATRSTTTMVIRARLLGYDAPEKTGATKPAGLAAKVALEHLVVGVPVDVDTFKTDRFRSGEKYDRWLTVIYAGDGSCVNERMVTDGHGIEWDGTGGHPIQH